MVVGERRGGDGGGGSARPGLKQTFKIKLDNAVAFNLNVRSSKSPKS